MEKPGLASQATTRFLLSDDYLDTRYIAFDFLTYTNIMIGSTYSSPAATYHNIKWRNTELRVVFGSSSKVFNSDIVANLYLYGGVKISSYPYLEEGYDQDGFTSYSLTPYNITDYSPTLGVGLNLGYCF